jgi:hypothetical protein
MANQTDIAAVLAVINVAYPNFTVTEKTVEVYWQILSDIPSDELKAAALHCISESGRKFAPSVGELRGAVGELRSLSNNVPSSFEAWQEFKKGRYSHPLVEKAANLIGRKEFGMSNVDDEPSWRARFIQAYEQLQARAEKEDLMVPEVRGYIEANGGKLMKSPMDQIRSLADGMRK